MTPSYNVLAEVASAVASAASPRTAHGGVLVCTALRSPGNGAKTHSNAGARREFYHGCWIVTALSSATETASACYGCECAMCGTW
jgi:hypothetical protein